MLRAAVFSSREELGTLTRTLLSLAQGRPAADRLEIDVLINGNASLAEATCKVAPRLDLRGASLRVWHLIQPDKAHTWNEFVHRLYDASDYAFFVDGYAAVEANALIDMIDVHLRSPDSLAVSGVQSRGPSAKTLLEKQLKTGGLCGNLYGLPHRTMERLRAAGFRLPTRIYRTDPTLAAALLLDLNPPLGVWSARRIVTARTAGFDYRTPSALSLSDWKSLYRRRLRQARGVSENRAIHEHFRVRRQPVSQLPETAYELVRGWHDRNPDEVHRLKWKDPLAWWALRQMLREAPPPLSCEPPQLRLSMRA